MIRSLSGEVFNASTSPARATPRNLANTQTQNAENEVETDSDSDSQKTMKHNLVGRRRSILWSLPTKKKKRGNGEQTASSSELDIQRRAEKAADLFRKLFERIHKLNREDLLSIFQY